MIVVPSRAEVWLAASIITDMRHGLTGLCALVQAALSENPCGGHVFVIRGRRRDLVKVLGRDGDGLCLFTKRPTRAKFIWRRAGNGTV